MREQSGLTLVEMLVGATLMIVVMGAVLTALNGFEKTSRANGQRNDAQELARTSMTALARDLRNGAAATASAPTGIHAASSYDLVFQMVDDEPHAGSANSGNLRRERYCLDTTDPSNGKLVRQTQTWSSATPPATPTTDACPSASWGDSRVLADHIVNREGGQDRPVFLSNASTTSEVTRLGIQLYVDASVDTNGANAEALLRSAVTLRNANRPPTATFTASPRANGHVVLNASASSDPEGERLSYAWFDGTTRLPLGSAIYDYDPPSGSRTLKLVVHDPGGLNGSATKTVTVP